MANEWTYGAMTEWQSTVSMAPFDWLRLPSLVLPRMRVYLIGCCGICPAVNSAPRPRKSVAGVTSAACISCRLNRTREKTTPHFRVPYNSLGKHQRYHCDPFNTLHTVCSPTSHSLCRVTNQHSRERAFPVVICLLLPRTQSTESTRTPYYPPTLDTDAPTLSLSHSTPTRTEPRRYHLDPNILRNLGLEGGSTTQKRMLPLLVSS